MKNIILLSVISLAAAGCANTRESAAVAKRLGNDIAAYGKAQSDRVSNLNKTFEARYQALQENYRLNLYRQARNGRDVVSQEFADALLSNDADDIDLAFRPLQFRKVLSESIVKGREGLVKANEELVDATSSYEKSYARLQFDLKLIDDIVNKLNHLAGANDRAEGRQEATRIFINAISRMKNMEKTAADNRAG